MSIKIQKISELYNLCCPTYNQAVLNVTASDTTVPDGGYWLNGGDCNFSFYRALPKNKWYLSGVVPPDDQKNDMATWKGFDSVILEGICRACDKSYYVAHMAIANTTYAEAEEYLHLNVPLGPQKNFLLSCPGSNDGKPWLLEKHTTSIGPLHLHTFGPFAMTQEDDSLCPACLIPETEEINPWNHGRDLLLPIFDELLSICAADDDINPATLEISSRPLKSSNFRLC